MPIQTPQPPSVYTPQYRTEMDGIKLAARDFANGIAINGKSIANGEFKPTIKEVNAIVKFMEYNFYAFRVCAHSYIITLSELIAKSDFYSDCHNGIEVYDERDLPADYCFAYKKAYMSLVSSRQF